MWQSWMRKNATKQVTLWMTPCLTCYFIAILFYIERKWLLTRNLATILPLKSKLSEKFQRFNAIDEIFYEAQRVSCLKEIIPPPPNPQPTPYQIRCYYVFGTKIFIRRYTKKYRHLLSKCFKNAFLWRQEMIQPKCFSDTKQEYVCWKICEVRKVFHCVAGAYYFQCQVSWGS